MNMPCPARFTNFCNEHLRKVRSHVVEPVEENGELVSSLTVQLLSISKEAGFTAFIHACYD